MTQIHASDRGDRLASGQERATFSVAPGLRFDEGIMRDDLKKLPAEEFILKYMITRREYDLIYGRDNEEKVSSFAEEMKRRGESYDKEIVRDAKQEASLDRPCDFLTPFVPVGITGRVIVSQDHPAKAPSKLSLPRSLRKDKELLPTTGHIIKHEIVNDVGDDVHGPNGRPWLGMRVLFSPMSGTAICFKGYPTWRLLELSEILCIVDKEDVALIDEELEPMV